MDLFLGIDGGATKTRLRLEDDHGNLLCQTNVGPGSLRLSVQNTWQEISRGLATIFAETEIDNQQTHLHVGMGLAGCEIVEAYQAFLKFPHRFRSLVVTSDSHTACLGAHLGKDGSIIIAGTGTVGYQIENKIPKQVGGFGFPHDDEGGGAWVGLQAVNATVKWLDGRKSTSTLVKNVFKFFNEDKNFFITWANQASPTAFAELAPIVIAASKARDTAALEILKNAAAAVNLIHQSLLKQQQKKLGCALLGGIASFITPFLNNDLKACLQPPLATPDVGAIFLVKQFLATQR